VASPDVYGDYPSQFFTIETGDYSMDKLSEEIKKIEDQIEKALWDSEVHEELDKALLDYQHAEDELEALGIEADNPAYTDQQRVLSYCLMRQGNILRQLEKPQEALELGKREIAAARASGDPITLGRALMSTGTNLIVAGKVTDGLDLLDDAREMFERGESYDHKQGLGWFWILQADLANAGLVEKEPAEVIEIATHALEILEPIENWPGVARGYAARATAREKLGDEAGAVLDRQVQKVNEAKIEPGESAG
jgi:tetratricopeptide (TPR) repeat protein